MTEGSQIELVPQAPTHAEAMRQLDDAERLLRIDDEARAFEGTDFMALAGDVMRIGQTKQMRTVSKKERSQVLRLAAIYIVTAGRELLRVREAINKVGEERRALLKAEADRMATVQHTSAIAGGAVEVCFNCGKSVTGLSAMRDGHSFCLDCA